MAQIVHPEQTASLDVVQPMPPLSGEQLDALREDIARNGVLVPITVDQRGRIIDGNNRAAVAAELGVDCPTTIVEVADDDAAVDMAVTLNCARRQLTQEQKRELIRAEIARRPDDSDRAVAKRVGCSPTTVGSVRKGADGVSNLDTSPMSRDEAEQITKDIQDALREARGALYAVVGYALTQGLSQAEAIGALTMARMRFLRRPHEDDEWGATWAKSVFDFIAEVVTWPETDEAFPPDTGIELSSADRAELVEMIASMGNENHPADLPEPA